MSATLFLVALDSMKRKVVEGRERGIRWKMMEQLGDLYFAEDICMMGYTHSDAHEKIN